MKRLLSIFIAFILICSTMLCVPIAVSAESLYIRKVVSVVYDDSGSMLNNNKYAYANYAMQAFCGMLNGEDKLYITYMNGSKQGDKYYPEEVDLSAGGIQSSVNSIRDTISGGGTPYTAVEVAYEKLKSVKDSNPNTQYWLVVITDGAFEIDGLDTPARIERHLNKEFKSYASDKMANGTHPQLTFMGIGDIASPKENKSDGIYTYSASDSSGIMSAMSKMADRVSGRTRLDKKDVKQVDSKTLQISSSIPLLNIAVLAQESTAKITKAVYSNEKEIPIGRKVSLSYPNIGELVGGAYLVGDSQSVIGSGSYKFTFDKEVKAEDVVFLLEPALEMRATIKLNGKEVKGLDELEEVMEKDKISLSCKIYEMGTDKEISPSLMPSGTKFTITVTEDGKTVKTVSGQKMELVDYVLKKLETELKASVIIDGFNPIDYTIDLSPKKYVPRVTYTMDAKYGNNSKSIKLNNLQSNKDMTICFTVYADGKAVTDPNVVKSLKPTINVSPQGNSGAISYTSDGKIVFTPNAATIPSDDVGSFDVNVTCTLNNGVKAKADYTVLIAEYKVIPIDVTDSIVKTKFFGNTVSASFYITKDGTKLDKSSVENKISVVLNEKHSKLGTNVVVADDGTITITPSVDKDYKLNFWSWWTNWAYYFGLEGSDVEIILNHSFGTAKSTINVVEEDIVYQIFCVYLPLIIELLILAAIIAYIVRYLTKARFASNGVIYVGSITRSSNRGSGGTHRLELSEIHLNQYNKFKNLWNPFKELTVSCGGVSITASKGNQIICNEPFPWYSDGIRPKSRTIQIETPKDVVNYCLENDELVINEIKSITVMDEQNKLISQDDSVYYFVRADITYVAVGNRQTEVIDSAVAFCYSTIQI